jgi:hypothetical protein
MDFQEWLEIGRSNLFVSPIICSTHDGIPGSDEETQMWEDGDDPCIHVMRVYPDKETAALIEPNVPVWRV